ncbi:hypothetical protein SLS57_006909 [Botryosphaeria dothidea]
MPLLPYLLPRDEPNPAPIPMGGRVISMILSLVTLTILAICITRRVEKVGKWHRLPITGWLIIIIYFDSFLFVFVTAMFKDVGINESQGICEGAILLCLVCYMSTKIFIYTFLVEKAYIVRGSHKPRLNDKLYIFNAFGLIIPYVAIVILNFVWRIAYINKGGTCIIGMQKKAMLPLIVFDVVINVYLTALFIIPLRLLFSVLVLHWVTSFDRTTTDSSYARDRENRNDGSGNTANPPSRNMTNGTLTNGQPLDPNDPAAKGGPRNSMRQHSQSPARNQSGWDAKATIRTQCSAGNEQPNPDEIALDRIVVKTERILEIESDGRSDRSDTTAGRDFGPRDCSSTDGIVDQV